MAAWGDLKNIFENPSRDSLSSWSQLLPEASGPSFEMFGELCHRVNPPPLPPPLPPRPLIPSHPNQPPHFRSLSWHDTMSEPDENSLQMFGGGSADSEKEERREAVVYARSYSDVRPRGCRGYSFPPPITSIGRCGKPRVYFKSYRKDGRFVLREIRIPTQQLLHATREDGRLRMRVIQPDEDVIGEEEEEEDETEKGSE